MKLNNKGFAITSIIYSMLILFLTLVVLIIGNLASRKAVFDKQKEDLLNKFEQEDTETSRLPEGYQKVEYITSDGKAWIDTGFVANQDTRVVVDFKYDVIDSKFLFGCRYSGTKNAYTVNITSSGTLAVTTYGTNANGNTTYATPDTDRHKIDKNKNIFTFYDAAGTEIKSLKFTYHEFECPGTLEIFASYDDNNGEGYLPSKATIYSFQIYDKGILKLDYVPCYELATEEYGLCDSKAETSEEIFYGNAASSGSFTGPAINS